jgi:RimJ/RimL family protein N-acetyltransferase
VTGEASETGGAVRGAHSILTARLLLRSWSAADAPDLIEAVESSLPELAVWMPWARDWAREREEVVERLSGFRAAFEEGRDWTYGVFDPGGRTVLGGAGLHTRLGPGALEIGYWIRTDATRRGYATEAAAALTRMAMERHGVERVEIRCDAANVASARVPERLGYGRTSVIDSPLPTLEGEPQRRLVWTMRRADYPGSPANRTPFHLRLP